jgi:hypothetical protein
MNQHVFGAVEWKENRNVTMKKAFSAPQNFTRRECYEKNYARQNEKSEHITHHPSSESINRFFILQLLQPTWKRLIVLDTIHFQRTYHLSSLEAIKCGFETSR